MSEPVDDDDFEPLECLPLLVTAAHRRFDRHAGASYRENVIASLASGEARNASLGPDLAGAASTRSSGQTAEAKCPVPTKGHDR
jgi:hypothetical protein